MDCEQSPISSVAPEQDRIIRLSGALGVADAEALWQTACEISENVQDVVVDWSTVSQLDVSIAQVLLALRAALTEQGKRLSSTGVPAPVRVWLQTAGLSDFLGPESESE